MTRTDHTQFGLDELVELLRAFPTDAELIDPATVFNQELDDSTTDRGTLRENTRMQRLSHDAYERERTSVSVLSAEVWAKCARATPEHILECVFGADGLGEGFPFYQGGDSQLVNALCACRHLLTTRLNTRGFDERKVRMNRAEEVDWEIWQAFLGIPVVPNPLVELARRDQEGQCVFETPSDRERALVVLESLSRRLWKLATTVEVEILRVRLLLQPDRGQEDLDSIRQYGDLMGVSIGEGCEDAAPVDELDASALI